MPDRRAACGKGDVGKCREKSYEPRLWDERGRVDNRTMERTAKESGHRKNDPEGFSGGESDER